MKRWWVGLVACCGAIVSVGWAALARPAGCTPPQAAFSWTAGGPVVAFHNGSSGAPPPSYLWTFGDGGTSGAISPTHPYAQPGAYDVSLLALNSCGGDTETQTVVVQGVPGRTFLALVGRGAGVVLPTPLPTAPATRSPVPTATPDRTPTAAPAFTVVKAADRERAYLGEDLVFSIGFANSLSSAAQVTVYDRLPAGLELFALWDLNCAGTVVPTGDGFQGWLAVPAGRSCQVVAVAVVVDPCDCYVVNSAGWVATWAGGGTAGQAASRPVFLSRAMPTPGGPR